MVGRTWGTLEKPKFFISSMKGAKMDIMGAKNVNVSICEN